jgi:hypothetical protein
MAKVKSVRHGYVEVDIDKERKFLDMPKNEPIYLKYNYNAIGDADREMKQFGSSTLLIFTNPRSIGTDDVRILLGAGLRHQFPGITTQVAGEIMDGEKFPSVLIKIMEALSYGMEGWFEGDAAQDVKDMRLRAVAVDGTEEAEEAGAEGKEEGAKAAGTVKAAKK